LELQSQQCRFCFGVVDPTPYHLEDKKFHFDDLSSSFHILYTNGLNDGLSIGSILEEEGLAPCLYFLTS
jgi:hypothetical protein